VLLGLAAQAAAALADNERADAELNMMAEEEGMPAPPGQIQSQGAPPSGRPIRPVVPAPPEPEADLPPPASSLRHSRVEQEEANTLHLPPPVAVAPLVALEEEASSPTVHVVHPPAHLHSFSGMRDSAVTSRSPSFAQRVPTLLTPVPAFEAAGMKNGGRQEGMQRLTSPVNASTEVSEAYVPTEHVHSPKLYVLCLRHCMRTDPHRPKLYVLRLRHACALIELMCESVV
jgi:hypothetical protein